MIPTSELKLVRDLLRHAVRLRPSIVLISMFGLFSAGIELAAIMSVVPLGILAGGKPIPAHSFWLVFPRWLGFTPDAKFFVLMFLALFLARMASFTGAQVMYSYIMQNLVADFSSRAYSTFIRSLSFTDIFRHQIGYYVSLAGDEANRGAQIVVGVMKLAPVIFLFLLYAIIIFLQSWMAGLGLITLIAVVVLSLRKTFAKSLALGQRQQEESRICNTHFIETLSSLRTIRSFTAEDFAAAHFLALMRKYIWTLFLSEALTQAAQLPRDSCYRGDSLLGCLCRCSDTSNQPAAYLGGHYDVHSSNADGQSGT